MNKYDVWLQYALLIFLCIFFMGCAGLRRDFQERNLFRITAPVTLTAAAEFESAKGLLVRQFAISPEFESSYFVYRIAVNQYIEDYYNKFIVPPGRMISDAVRESLYHSPFFRSVAPNQPQDITFRLGGKIVELYGDMQNPGQPQAVMSLRLTLEKRKADAGFMPIISTVYAASTDILPDGDTAASLTNGWNQCLSSILSDFSKDFAGLSH